MSDIKPVTVAATIFWADLDKINDMSKKYQVILGQLSDSAVRAIEAMGIEVQSGKADQGYYITCKSKYPIVPIDKDGEAIYDNVGNGSKCVAVLGSYEWRYKSKVGKSPSLMQLKITDLIVYVPQVVEEDEAL